MKYAFNQMHICLNTHLMKCVFKDLSIYTFTQMLKVLFVQMCK